MKIAFLLIPVLLSFSAQAQSDQSSDADEFARIQGENRVYENQKREQNAVVNRVTNLRTNAQKFIRSHRGARLAEPLFNTYVESGQNLSHKFSAYFRLTNGYLCVSNLGQCGDWVECEKPGDERLEQQFSLTCRD